jgi:hypothetical protein
MHGSTFLEQSLSFHRVDFCENPAPGAMGRSETMLLDFTVIIKIHSVSFPVNIGECTIHRNFTDSKRNMRDTHVYMRLDAFWLTSGWRVILFDSNILPISGH